jgi:hypothetical protein
VVSRHDLRVYAACYADEEDLCVEVRGAVVGVSSGQVDCPEGWGMGGSSVLWRYCYYIRNKFRIYGGYMLLRLKPFLYIDSKKNIQYSQRGYLWI